MYRIHDHHDKDWPAPKEELSDNRGCRKENDDKVFKFLLCFLLLYTNEYINFYQEYITHTMIRINNKRNGEPEGDDGLFKSMYFFLSSLFFSRLITNNSRTTVTTTIMMKSPAAN